MNLRAKLLLSSLAASALIASAPAYADTITLDSNSIGNSYTFNYNGFSGANSPSIDGLTASTTFTLTGISGNQYTFDYSVTNTTSDPVNSRISSFGFNTDPNITGASSTGAFAYTTVGSSYPNGIGAIDVCFKDASTGSCAGGGGGGIADGLTGAGTFILTFANALSNVTLGDFYVRYQSVSGAGNVSSASGIGSLTSSTSSSSSGGEVPEPGVLGLLGGGLIALGLMTRRKRKATAAA
ncbi:cistern family PEP-CTERM protein [Caenibius sp. WL]|uniref:cistern family PEP-CTERM protein n=1 Tax=Caenibius sp. WL TaxID=2872646 RepID=UPI001C98EA83|nr:cistern family PEP-CTERM protein [Caenibius sp. WL]QZP08937.1 cistern family PEP-CTERM protein [Caenibius sp. WL]